MTDEEFNREMDEIMEWVTSLPNESEENKTMRKHIFFLYVIGIIALSIAVGAAFGQRSDYLRLNALGAPKNTLIDLFHR